MTKEVRATDYLGHICKSVARALRYVDGLDGEALKSNGMVQYATVRDIDIVGEAARNIQRADPGFAKRFPDFPLVKALGGCVTRLRISTPASGWALSGRPCGTISPVLARRFEPCWRG